MGNLQEGMIDIGKGFDEVMAEAGVGEELYLGNHKRCHEALAC